MPISNADQYALFLKKEIDGAWAPEPWASRLVVEAGGIRVIDERDLWPGSQFCTSNVIVRREFLEQSPDLVEKWLKAHIEITDFMNDHPEEAKRIVNEAIEALSTKKIPEAVLSAAWPMLELSYNPAATSDDLCRLGL